MRITNGYGNLTRPYRLYRYTGATRVMKDSIQCYAIDISENLVIESRDYMESSVCHYSGLPSTSSYAWVSEIIVILYHRNMDIR